VIALVVLALMAGAALGVIFMGMVTAGRREDECRACRRAAVHDRRREEVRREAV
jgi:hypothetical protein